MLIHLVRGEELCRKAPQIIEGTLHACMAVRRAISEPHQPAAAETVVVAGLLQSLGRDRRQACIAGGGERLVEFQLPGIDQPLAHDGAAEVSVGLLGEGEVQKVGCIAKKGQRILIASPALEFPGVGQQQPRLSDEIE